MKTFTGGCHCKAVRYEISADVTKAIRCNCSHCSVKGLLLDFIPAENFKLLSGEGDLTEYRFNKKHLAHLFCKQCGVESFAQGAKPDGTKIVAINLNCIDDLDLASLSITHVDGKSL